MKNHQNPQKPIIVKKCDYEFGTFPKTPYGTLPEMEKHADGVDASVLFFPLCCANFLAVYMQNS